MHNVKLFIVIKEMPFLTQKIPTCTGRANFLKICNICILPQRKSLSEIKRPRIQCFEMHCLNVLLTQHRSVSSLCYLGFQARCGCIIYQTCHNNAPRAMKRGSCIMHHSSLKQPQLKQVYKKVCVCDKQRFFLRDSKEQLYNSLMMRPFLMYFKQYDKISCLYT